MAEANSPPIISHGVPLRVMNRTAVTITIGPRVRPNSPPTIQKPIPRPSLRPERLPAITGPTACMLAELIPTTIRNTASAA